MLKTEVELRATCICKWRSNRHFCGTLNLCALSAEYIAVQKKSSRTSITIKMLSLLMMLLLLLLLNADDDDNDETDDDDA